MAKYLCFQVACTQDEELELAPLRSAVFIPIEDEFLDTMRAVDAVVDQLNKRLGLQSPEKLADPSNLRIKTYCSPVEEPDDPEAVISISEIGSLVEKYWQEAQTVCVP